MRGALNLRNAIFLIFGAIALSGVARGEVVVSTLGYIPSYPAFVPDIGTGSPGDFGESITAPNLPVVQLSAFQFDLGSAGTVPVNFRAAVFNFDAVDLKVIGLPLYESSVLNALPVGSLDGYQLFDFDAGDISLVPGNSYLLLLSQDNLQNATNYQLPVTPAEDGDVYSGGEVIFVTANTPFPNLSGDPSGSFLPGQDLAFSATFDVPEPTCLVVIIPGVLLFGHRRAYQQRLRVTQQAGYALLKSEPICRPAPTLTLPRITRGGERGDAWRKIFVCEF